MNGTLSGSKAKSKQEEDDEECEKERNDGVLVLNAFDWKEQTVLEIAVSAEPNHARGGVYGEADDWAEDEVDLGQH